ncbi:MAG TPA: DoxX family protein [Blastocatellia bacterium]|nr:DoxX family protein [Blastocatellia bacterium]
MKLNNGMNILSWILRLVVAGILFQTLFFKFTGAQESVYIFTKLGIEPWGRIGSGVVELIAVILLLIPSTVTIGAILSLGTISVAILSHLTKLGIVVVNSDGSSDGGLLFALALTVFVCSAIILAIYRREIPVIGSALFGAGA